MKKEIGGIKFIPEKQKVDFDSELVSIANNLLSLTNQSNPHRTDYDYNCLIGMAKIRLSSLSNQIERMRIADVEKRSGISAYDKLEMEPK